MGYELHIVRRRDWDNFEEDSEISLEEWLAYVAVDKELELTNGYLIKIPGVENSFQHVPGFCNWRKHPTKTGEDQPWFDYGFGMISAKYPDDETIKKMITIAAALNGKVQGDDGEFYDGSYFLSKTDSMPQPIEPTSASKKPWWKFW